MSSLLPQGAIKLISNTFLNEALKKMEARKSLYYLSTCHGIKVYDQNNHYLGKTTDFKAIAHDGKSIGSIEIKKQNEEVEWVSGYGVFIVGMGIKIVD